MKNICLYCGNYKSSTRKYYCSTACGEKLWRRNPCTVKKHFDIFKNLVAAAENYDEFKKLYKKYFRSD